MRANQPYVTEGVRQVTGEPSHTLLQKKGDNKRCSSYRHYRVKAQDIVEVATAPCALEIAASGLLNVAYAGS